MTRLGGLYMQTSATQTVPPIDNNKKNAMNRFTVINVVICKTVNSRIVGDSAVAPESTK